jgi:hypothetical protein
MTSREFCYWLQGYFELATIGESEEVNKTNSLSIAQRRCIQNHLNMVFKHEIDPSLGSVEHQAELSSIHAQKPVAEISVTEDRVRKLIQENLPHRDLRDIPLTC